MLQKKGLEMKGIVNAIYRHVNAKGVEQLITEMTLKNGRKATEIVTELSDGNKGVRIIERDFLGCPEKVIDNVFGRKETYVPAYPEREKGVFQYTEDNIRSYFPNISFEKLCEY